MISYKNWTAEETNLLKELYPQARVRDLAKRFPKRTKDTIVAKALALNLPSAKLWQPGEYKILKKYFKTSPKEDLIKLLPKRSWLAIMAMGERLGLKRKRNKPRLNVNEDYFTNWTTNMAYILGFILADGCIIRGTYKGYSDSLKFGVQRRDIDILEKIKSELKAEHKISILKKAVHFSISSQKIVDDLKKLGVSYNKSLNEQAPNVPQEYIRDFIRGIVDGDGSLWIDKRGYPTLSVSGGKNTLKFVQDHFFEQFRLYSVLGKRTYSKEAKNYLYQITYRASSAKELIEYLYSNAKLYLLRKYLIAQKCYKNVINRKDNDKYVLKRYHESYTG